MKAALFGVIAFTALGLFALAACMTEVGADVFLAIIEVVTPPGG